MKKAILFSRLDFIFNPLKNIDRVEYTLPDSSVVIGQTFKQVECGARYDEYGYYHPEATATYCLMSRFTPYLIGVHKWAAMSGEECIYSGEFDAFDGGELTGYVTIGEDRRYFMLSNSQSFVPIGMNLRFDKMRDSSYYSSDEINFGIEPYLRRIRHFAENGGNLICLSLTDPMFNCRTEFQDRIRPEAFFNLEQIIELCRERNIKVKLTLDSFKTLKDDPLFAKRDRRTIRSSTSGRQISDIKSWINDDYYFKKWLMGVCEYLYRFWNDPVIMAFELWDEIDLIDAPREDILRFSKKAISAIKKICPQNLVTTCISPLYSEDGVKTYKEFFADTNISFGQVRRFLNSTAELTECRDIPNIMASTAIERVSGKDKPVLLSETGACDGYTNQPYYYYSTDYNGVILNDCAFAPFFKGAAGTGIFSHVKEYIEPHNLFCCYKPFSDMLHNIKIHKQYFKPLEIARKKAYVYVLKGRNTTLIYVRSKVDTWQNVMREDCTPFLIKGISIPSFSGKKAKLYPFFKDDAPEMEITLSSKSFTLPAFRYGYFIKIR